MLARTLTVILFFCASATLARGQNVADKFVDPTAPGIGSPPVFNGDSWESAYPTVQDAVDSLLLTGLTEGASQPIAVNLCNSNPRITNWTAGLA